MGVLVLALLGLAAGTHAAGDYPTKTITLYCAYGAGGVADQYARALAEEAGKMLGVSVVVENKAGGAGTVCATLLANKEPDGYSLGIMASGVITIRPSLLTVDFDGYKDFTPVASFTHYNGGLCVNADSPIKNINEFIEYAKAHPGMPYSSSGTYIQQQLSVEVLAQCKGLTFKHVPFTGGMEDITALLGKHVDFLAGSGQHIRFTKDGKLRFLLLLNQDKRDPKFPEVPTLKELGCPDLPALKLIVVGPKKMPDSVVQKLEDTFKKASQTPTFQKVLEYLDMNYEFYGRKELEKLLPEEAQSTKAFLDKMGVKKQ
jgi:tripartite-type tricarboxylate transporter receptor subunit TctC